MCNIFSWFIVSIKNNNIDIKLSTCMYISNILLNFTPFAQLYNYNRAPSLSVFSLRFNFSKRTFFKVHLFFAVLISSSLKSAVGYEANSW